MCRLSVLLLIVHGPHYFDVDIVTIAITSVAIAFPTAIQSRALWLSIGLALAPALVAHIYVTANHKILMLYWCIVISLAATSPPALAQNARMLVAIVFTFAVTWKVASPDYLSGDFMHYTLLTDVRFQTFGNYLDITTPATFRHNVTELGLLKQGELPLATLAAGSGDALAARVFTWGTLIMEAAIAAAFWIPQLGPLRAYLMMCFAISTYSIAPVIGFAWLLLIMTYAASVNRPTHERAALLLLIPVTELFVLPIGELALQV